MDRMKEDRQKEMAYTETLEGDRPRGRYRQRWRDNLQKDIRALEVDSCQEKVKNREKMKMWLVCNSAPQCQENC